MITAEKKMEYLRFLAIGKGIRNILNGSIWFCEPFCQHMGIPATDVCVALLNRLNGDQVTSTKEASLMHSRTIHSRC